MADISAMQSECATQRNVRHHQALSWYHQREALWKLYWKKHGFRVGKKGLQRAVSCEHSCWNCPRGMTGTDRLFQRETEGRERKEQIYMRVGSEMLPKE